MLLELGYPLSFDWKVSTLNGYADNPADVPEPTKEYREPSYWAVKEWLWNRHRLVVNVDINKNKQCFCCIRDESMNIIIPGNILSENWIPYFFDSPIDAEIDGIKKIIAHLYDEYLKTKSV